MMLRLLLRLLLRMLLRMLLYLRLLLRMLLILRMLLRLLHFLRMLLRLLHILRMLLRLLPSAITSFSPAITHLCCFNRFMKAIINLALESLQLWNLMAFRLVIESTPIAFERFLTISVSTLETHS